MADVYVTQYLLPHGKTRRMVTSVPDDLADTIQIIKDVGAVLEAEILTTGEVSVTITSGEWGDYDIAVVPNGPQVPAAVEQLIRRFDPQEYCAYEQLQT